MQSVDLDTARRTFIGTLRACEQAETRTQRTIEAAVVQRDADLLRIRQTQTSWRQRSDAILAQAREASHEADKLLMQLRLGQARLTSPASTAIPTGVEQLERQFQANSDTAARGIASLRATAERLTAERMKWWKPW